MAVAKKITPRGTNKIEEKPREVEEKIVETPEVEEVEVAETAEGAEDKVTRKQALSKKVCFFHKSQSEPHFWDTATLRKFLNDRGRITARARTGNCAKHQRRVSREIKRARFLALLPFTASL